ncbi:MULTISPECIES: hypothetical protein [unclassified Streptomyces]|uniref:hypothetical protein n=1 Tax=unclassified Streptomyces TaxID=2593676 RepID=UPI004043232D
MPLTPAEVVELISEVRALVEEVAALASRADALVNRLVPGSGPTAQAGPSVPPADALLTDVGQVRGDLLELPVY